MAQAMDELETAWLTLSLRVDELASERVHYLDFFEGADAAFLVTDADGKILEANGAAVDLLDRRRSYLKGKPLAALVASDARREFRRQLQQLSEGEPWRTCLATQGRRIEIVLRARAIPAARGIVWSLRAA